MPVVLIILLIEISISIEVNKNALIILAIIASRLTRVFYFDSFCQSVSTNPYKYKCFSRSTIVVLSELQTQTKGDDRFAPAKRMFYGEGSKGLGGAVRIAPLALYYFYEEEKQFNV